MPTAHQLSDRLARVVLVAGLLASPAAAGIIVEDRPVSLVSATLVMEQGIPCVPLADVARALGGTLRVDLESRVLAITPGQAGALRLNPSRLAASPRVTGPGDGRATPQGQAAERGVLLRLGADAVRLEGYDSALLRPRPLMPLPLLAKLLGGSARFDPAANVWMLPKGGAADPLQFR